MCFYINWDVIRDIFDGQDGIGPETHIIPFAYPRSTVINIMFPFFS